jgi:cytochrome c peroxidase
MKQIKLSLIIISIIICLPSCNNSKSKEEKLPDKQEQMILKMAQSYFTPLAEHDFKNQSPDKKKMVELGRRLFYDKILSGEQKINCASCHDIKNYGAGKEPVSKGNKEQPGFRNPPSIINAYLQYSQNWDAKYKNVEDQLIAMILSKTEMGMTDTLELLNRLRKDPFYIKTFTDAFPGSNPAISLQTLKQALGSFLRTLTSPSRFDDFLRGDTDALTLKEKIGLKTFMENGCVPCHSSPLVGGSMAQKFALFGYYWDFTNSKNRDKGRYELTKNPADEYFFKVPQLRNVEKTSPYFHDGSVSNLEEAIRIMAMTEANRQLEEKDIENIAAFLRSLTGKIPEHALEN